MATCATPYAMVSLIVCYKLLEKLSYKRKLHSVSTRHVSILCWRRWSLEYFQMPYTVDVLLPANTYMCRPYVRSVEC